MRGLIRVRIILLEVRLPSIDLANRHSPLAPPAPLGTYPLYTILVTLYHLLAPGINLSDLL